MKELDKVSFAIELNEEILKLSKDTLFKIIRQKDKYYITSFEDKIITQFTPKNLNADAKEFLENIPTNYSCITLKNKNNNYAIVESKRIFKIIAGIEKLNIFYENKRPDNVYIKDVIDSNEKAILIYNHIHRNEQTLFHVESNFANKVYSVSEKTEYDSENEYKAETILIVDEKEKRIKKDSYQSLLFVGNIGFSSTKEYIPDSDKLKLFTMQIDVQNYLNLWDEYNRIELEREFLEFKRVSYIRYSSLLDNEGIRLFFDDDNFSRISDFKDKMCFIGDNGLLSLFIADDIKSYNDIEKSLLGEKRIIVAKINENTINKIEKSIKLSVQDKAFFRNSSVSNVGYICLSLLGNKISYNRRENAKERIIKGKAGIQKMFTWFTDNPEPNISTERVEINANLLTKKNLTSNQREAIEIICNTPDIAILQGPPGTGKTTTIREALIQLNAQTENKYNFGNNLLSGFRHETVLNLTESIDLFGLPAVKIGDSSKDEKTEEIEPRVLSFVNDLIDALKDKYKDLTKEEDIYLEFKRKYLNYMLFNNSIDSSIDILNDIKKIDIFKYDNEVHKNIDDMISALKKENKNISYEEESFINFLYGLPILEESYLDDKDRISIELLCFGVYDNLKLDVEKLQKVYSTKPYSSNLIKSVRRELILKYRKRPKILISSREKQKIIVFLNELFEKVRCERLKRFDGHKIAILDYIDSLSENPHLVRDTLLKYTKVLGATNQQSISKNMFEAKSDDVIFDNVFIDEAATSSPLDLFIPMSIAKKKVILVGDHKQLPNITDEGIIDEVKAVVYKSSDSKKDEKENNTISSTMKKTLFEVLMDKAHELEKKDGKKRVITLNTQFRMHPKLGEMVSELFYDGVVKSVRPESHFSHNYHDMTDRYLYWLDTPYDPYYKKEYREKGSKSRKNVPEAKRIAAHIKEALDASNYENVTIGIITMYKDQVKAINDELRKIGITDENGNKTNQEILVGTVDAFQGREFDIVYLSLVYVFNEDTNYSRLASENSKSLMCVAMSRQKRLLIVVGDMSVYSTNDAKKKVEPLYRIARLCLGGDMYE